MKKASIGTMVFVVFLAVLLISYVLGIPGTITQRFGSIMNMVGTIGDYSRSMYRFFTGSLFPSVEDFEYWNPAADATSSAATGSVKLTSLRTLFRQCFNSERSVYLDGYWSIWSDQKLWHFNATNENGQPVTYYIRTDKDYSIMDPGDVTFFYYFLGTSYNGSTWNVDGDYLFARKVPLDGAVMNTEPFPKNVIVS